MTVVASPARRGWPPAVLHARGVPDHRAHPAASWLTHGWGRPNALSRGFSRPNASSKLRFALPGTFLGHLAGKTPYFSRMPRFEIGTFMERE